MLKEKGKEYENESKNTKIYTDFMTAKIKMFEKIRK